MSISGKVGGSQKTDGYVICKLDKNKKVTYANSAFLTLSGYGVDEILGEDMKRLRHASMPQAGVRFFWEALEDKGFFNACTPHRSQQGNTFWLFLDFGKRYTSEEGTFLGYEYLGYPPSPSAVAFFEELYAKMLAAEQAQPGEPGIAAARAILDAEIQSAGKSYEALANSLQAL